VVNTSKQLVINTGSLKNFIIDEQHGSMSGRSTTTNLLVLQYIIINSFKLNCQVEVIYTDFAKAVDKIDHSIFAKKLTFIS